MRKSVDSVAKFFPVLKASVQPVLGHDARSGIIGAADRSDGKGEWHPVGSREKQSGAKVWGQKGGIYVIRWRDVDFVLREPQGEYGIEDVAAVSQEFLFHRQQSSTFRKITRNQSANRIRDSEMREERRNVLFRAQCELVEAAFFMPNGTPAFR
jgi:hypothetical protein